MPEKLLDPKYGSCEPTLKPGLHIAVKIAEHVCDYVTRRILKLPTYQLQVFLLKDEHLLSLQRYEDQAIHV